MRHNSRPFKIEPEPDFPQSLFVHRMAQADFVLGVKHQKASPSGPDEFSTERPIRERVIVQLVDFAIGNTRIAMLLMLPVNVHQSGEFRDVSLFQRQLRRESYLLREMQILRHLFVRLPALVILLFQNLGCGARVSGEEQQEVVFQIEQRLFGNRER